MKTVEREVLPGIRLRAVQTGRFKTASLAIAFLTSLKEETASVHALIPFVLRRGCKKFPDLASVNFELDYLYGASAEPLVQKQGDVQYIGFYCSGIDDSYLSLEKPMLTGLLELTHDLLLDPVLEHGMFCSDVLNSEKENLVNAILSEKNEKLSYAYQRATSKLFRDQGLGVNAFGDAKNARSITAGSAYSAYRNLLKTAPLTVTYCGNAPFETVADAVRSVFADFSRDVVDRVACSVPVFLNEKLDCNDVMDVAQTVLIVGLEAPQDEVTMRVLSAVLGGGTASKLFLNVRERASLCYYTGSVYQPRQNSLCMYAGVEDGKTSLACEKMLCEFQNCVDAKITEEELSQAKQVLINQLKTTRDTAGALLSYWVERAVCCDAKTPSELAAEICNVTRDEVIDAARACNVKLIYRLCGKESVSDERECLPEHQ